MKTLFLRLVIPLTIISFAFITKWWYALPEDAPETMYKGFPLIYSGPAWHTSLAYQFFVVEFVTDLFAYFLCWFIVVYSINRFWFAIKPSRFTTISLWSVTLLIITYYAIIAGPFNHAIDFKRPYPINIIATGCEFFWQHTQRH